MSMELRVEEHSRHARTAFLVAWLSLCALKLALAARLPLFVDEAFYWQEGRHLALAYSDLPGLTAWLARLGVALGGNDVLALRLPFLLIGALLPWLVVRMAAREFDARTGWQAGLLCLLLPLAGTLGVLALPDVPLLLASVLCLDAGLRALGRVDAMAISELALGLVIGGLTHYRFAAVIVAGLVALLLLREGRAALRRPGLWLAIASGALAWLPLLLWNVDNAEAGLRFQLVDRHPWSFGWHGIALGLMQLLPATPLLLVALALAGGRGLRDTRPQARWLALCGVLLVFAFLALGFFTDRRRVSFHWTLPGFVALLPLVPAVLAGWTRGWRIAAWATTALGLAAALGYFLLAASPTGRTWAARHDQYPANFAGWNALDAAVRERLARMPDGTRILAGDFKIGAELGFARGDADIRVLDHPLNRKHGRAPQLALWGLQFDGRMPEGGAPLLLVASPSHAGFPDAQSALRSLCEQLGPLPPAQVLDVDGGAKRFVLYEITRVRPQQRCAGP
ncbi:glycosyltransferase family 39 protein [Thermomonas sp.]|uniref:ArnT family glycosyltransferase n=1 Tax=Thermomonas sp. TaxID=1971895 RepID=UPI002612F9A6|nr:glycosyltransferase family 39 protein [Thermomonas sp.]